MVKDSFWENLVHSGTRCKIQNYRRQRNFQGNTCAFKYCSLEFDGLTSPESCFFVLFCLTFEVQLSQINPSQRLLAIVTGIEKLLSWTLEKWDMESKAFGLSRLLKLDLWKLKYWKLKNTKLETKAFG